jgi:hypothetical protein
VFLGRDDQQRAVVLALFADAPGAADRDAPFLDRPPLQRVERHDDKLVARRRLQVFQLGRKLFRRRGGKDMRLVDHPSRQHGRGNLRGPGQGRGHEPGKHQGQQQNERRSLPPYRTCACHRPVHGPAHVIPGHSWGTNPVYSIIQIYY